MKTTLGNLIKNIIILFLSLALFVVYRNAKEELENERSKRRDYTVLEKIVSGEYLIPHDDFKFFGFGIEKRAVYVLYCVGEHKKFVKVKLENGKVTEDILFLSEDAAKRIGSR